MQQPQIVRDARNINRVAEALDHQRKQEAQANHNNQIAADQLRKELTQIAATAIRLLSDLDL